MLFKVHLRLCFISKALKVTSNNTCNSLECCGHILYRLFIFNIIPNNNSYHWLHMISFILNYTTIIMSKLNYILKSISVLIDKSYIMTYCCVAKLAKRVFDSIQFSGKLSRHCNKFVIVPVIAAAAKVESLCSTVCQMSYLL